MLHAEKHAIEIYRLLAAPVGEWHRQDRAGDGDSGVVDEYLEFSEPRADFRDHAYPGIFAGDIVVQIDSVAAGALDRGNTILALVVLDIGDDDGRALLGEQERRRAANTAGAATHECDFSFDAIHHVSNS